LGCQDKLLSNPLSASDFPHCQDIKDWERTTDLTGRSFWWRHSHKNIYGTKRPCPQNTLTSSCIRMLLHHGPNRSWHKPKVSQYHSTYF